MLLKEITLELSEFKTRDQAHRYLRQSLNLPDYYGENLDALYDCLGDIGTPTIINVPKALAGAAYLDAYGEKMLRVLRLAAEENPDLKVKLY